MKIRLTGTPEEFQLLNVDDLDRNKFLSFRKPQKGGNPRYKPGGEKYDPKTGEVLLMYVEVAPHILDEMFSGCRVKTISKHLKATKK
ncbi:hypothetical protein SAMN04515674_104239 [Pseudarcicella hirudinis]|uniref:Uncharacterized protein n=1 Tax=Pseudarcicella hirudinis TaxID=1079859 RepID=A0A1I5RTI5_9BACT|nr:hypothetical protein [Pseudarcicella hirudinis]SFP61879.1 hypothetical protein SAMN04515674_104239 [Pseudarcicella hirudinis]